MLQYLCEVLDWILPLRGREGDLSPAGGIFGGLAPCSHLPRTLGCPGLVRDTKPNLLEPSTYNEVTKDEKLNEMKAPRGTIVPVGQQKRGKRFLK